MPNYREVDRDPRWHQWLLQTDPLSGVPRQQILNDAIASTDANRVAAFFRGFKQEAGNQSSGSAATAPGRASSSSSGRPIYTRDQIAKLYDDTAVVPM